MSYADFLASKRRKPPASGIDVHPDELLSADSLFPFQRQIVAWAVGRGRAAVWADTGLGKTRIEVAWLDQILATVEGTGLILAPLAVAQQTIREARRMGCAGYVVKPFTPQNLCARVQACLDAPRPTHTRWVA